MHVLLIVVADPLLYRQTPSERIWYHTESDIIPPGTTKANSTHPAGMLSCLKTVLLKFSIPSDHSRQITE